MLVLSRKQGESIILGDNIFIKVLSTGGEADDKVKLAIEAPEDVRITRAELAMGREEQRRKMNAVHSERLGRRTQRELQRLGLISGTTAEESAS